MTDDYKFEKINDIPFYGKITLEDKLPIDSRTLTDEVTQYVNENLSEDSKFVVAKEDEAIVGFSIVKFPSNNQEPAKLIYRYVFPEHRRRGVGRKLKDGVYDFCYELGYKEINSGVNAVVRLSADGSVVANLNKDRDGGWATYLSFTKSNAKTVVSHSISLARIAKGGFLSIDVSTKLGGEEPQMLPNSPDELLDFLRSSGVVPSELTNAELFDRIKRNADSIYRDGRSISLSQFMNEVDVIK